MTQDQSLKSLAKEVLTRASGAEHPRGTSPNKVPDGWNTGASEAPVEPGRSALLGPEGGTVEHPSDGDIYITVDELLAPDVRPCCACGRCDPWTDRLGNRKCRICHPPAPGAERR